jgi:hypothetical protein
MARISECYRRRGPAWRLREGKLTNRDGHEYTPGEVWSIGLQHQHIAGLEATIRELRAADLGRLIRYSEVRWSVDFAFRCDE